MRRLTTIKKFQQVKTVILAGLFSVLLIACKKDILKTQPRTDVLIPTTLADFQALLDNYDLMNVTPVLGELSSDDYYLSGNSWEGLNILQEKNGYIWKAELFEGNGDIPDWNQPYTQVLYCNIILESIDNVSGNVTQAAINAIRGDAYFKRAFAFYNLAQLFTPPYDNTTAATDLGLPLRLQSDIRIKVPRSSVKETYEQIIADLQQAYQLLPATIPASNKNRASKPAALAMLARVNLTTGNYVQAGMYAGDLLQLYDSVVNYNANEFYVNPFIPFLNGNHEVIYQSQMHPATGVINGIIYPETVVDSGLLQMYAANDLRTVIYYFTGFTGNINLKGSYTGKTSPFSGLATDEIYLIRAECHARNNEMAAALDDLNTLWEKRAVSGTYAPLTASSQQDAIQLVLDERRKELAFRGLRWTDLRRLNKMGAGITLQRVAGGVMYSLPPNSNLYVLQIPPDVLTLSGIEPNIR